MSTLDRYNASARRLINEALDQLTVTAEREVAELGARFDAMSAELARVKRDLHDAEAMLYHVSKHLPSHVPICPTMAAIREADIDLADEVRNALADARRNTQERPESAKAQADAGEGYAKEAEVSAGASQVQRLGAPGLTPLTSEPAKLDGDGAPPKVGAPSIDDEDFDFPF